MTTDTDAKYLIRRLSDTPEERGVCGWRKTLVTRRTTRARTSRICASMTASTTTTAR